MGDSNACGVQTVARREHVTSGVRNDGPPALQRWWSNTSSGLADILYRPDALGMDGLSLEGALGALSESAMPVPDGLIPVTFVDDWSLGCLATADSDGYGWSAGDIVRWHLDSIDPRFQGALLDVDLDQYISSLLNELGPAWDKGYKGIIRLSGKYRDDFVEQQVKPKAHDLRPFQLACQNVIIGLAAFKQDFRIDGEAVPYWLTCEAPHVATYEGSRALAALLLCDAFQSGGTMEISFADHAERKVPASLRRYARTLGIRLGAEIGGGRSISPGEARALFMAVTPMPPDLREQCRLLVDSGMVSTERLCYTLLAAVWSAVGLHFLAACASGERLRSILTGGADVFDRRNRAAEMELARAAVILDTFIRRVDAKDAASSGGGQAARLFEDTTNGVEWRLHGDLGAVEVLNVPAGRLPWHSTAASGGRVIVLPRPHPIGDDFDLARRLATESVANGAPVVVLTAAGSTAEDRDDIAVLKCPVRLAEMDLEIERSLLASTLGRA